MSRTERQPRERRAPGGRTTGARRRGWRRGALRLALGLVTSLAASGTLAVASAASGDCTITGGTTTCTYTYTGAAQTWTVPAGISQATVDVYGAQGGGSGGGLGGRPRPPHSHQPKPARAGSRSN